MTPDEIARMKAFAAAMDLAGLINRWERDTGCVVAVESQDIVVAIREEGIRPLAHLTSMPDRGWEAS